MILQALVQYYENLVKQDKIAKTGWCHAKVSYVIDLNEDGEIREIMPVNAVLCVPEMVTRTSGISANFLCDNAKFIFGIDATGTTKRTIECFQATRDRHLTLLQNASGIMAKAICKFFASWNPEKAKENVVVQTHWDEITDGGNLIFGMGTKYAQDDENVKYIWEKEQQQGNEEQTGICLVTGMQSEIARIHRGIKGVPGSQTSGAALVSFNAPAFESYGKEQSYNAPVGKYAEFAYTTALNYLLNQRDYRFQVGDSMIVFWSESGKQEDQKNFLSFINPKQENQEELKKIFDNLRQGHRVDVDDIDLDLEQKFYILCLAPNAARLSVRFFYQNTVGTILENISKHYERMKIVKPAWENMDYLGIRETLDKTVNQKSKDKTPVPEMAAKVLEAVLSDARYPVSLYADTMIRIRAEQGNVRYERAAIIKAFLIQNYDWKEGEMYMGLNATSKDVPYVLGRLFAVLESIQKDVNPGINATIRDRYFNSACATPATIFPVLIKLKGSHMKKMERDAGGMKVYYEKMLTELMGKIEMAPETGGFPRHLTLEEQGRFMLGYYHQIQKKYEKKENQ